MKVPCEHWLVFFSRVSDPVLPHNLASILTRQYEGKNVQGSSHVWSHHLFG